MAEKLAILVCKCVGYFGYNWLFFQMDELLPRESGTYLKIILGSVNVSILDRKARYDYKDQYEQFKLIVNLIGIEPYHT